MNNLFTRPYNYFLVLKKMCFGKYSNKKNQVYSFKFVYMNRYYLYVNNYSKIF